jgi:hypothetical protein
MPQQHKVTVVSSQAQETGPSLVISQDLSGSMIGPEKMINNKFVPKSSAKAAPKEYDELSL